MSHIRSPQKDATPLAGRPFEAKGGNVLVGRMPQAQRLSYPIEYNCCSPRAELAALVELLIARKPRRSIWARGMRDDPARANTP